MSAHFTHGDQDVVIAGGLITSPAWASWLAEFNTVLTTLTLILGLVLGATRLWGFYRKHMSRR